MSFFGNFLAIHHFLVKNGFNKNLANASVDLKWIYIRILEVMTLAISDLSLICEFYSFFVTSFVEMTEILGYKESRIVGSNKIIFKAQNKLKGFLVEKTINLFNQNALT